VQNSIRAKASEIQVMVIENHDRNRYVLSIKDNGSGMDRKTLEKAIDPFYTSRTTRKVGLGLSLIKQNAEQAGGIFSIKSEPGKGTLLEATFQHDHLDRPSLGDISGTIVLIAAANPSICLKYIHQTPDGDYEFNTNEVRQVLDDVPLSDVQIQASLREMITENLKTIRYSK